MNNNDIRIVTFFLNNAQSHHHSFGLPINYEFSI